MLSPRPPLLLITPAKITIFGQKYLKCLCGLFVMGWSVSICVRTCSYGLATSDVPLREIREWKTKPFLGQAAAHVPMCPVPMCLVPMCLVPIYSVPMCPCAQPRWRVFISDVLPNIGVQKTRAFRKEKGRKQTTRKWFPSTCIISPGHICFIFIVQAIVR